MKVTKREQALIDTLRVTAGVSIYELAQRNAMQYKRAFESVKKLTAMGLCAVEKSVRNGRRVNLCFLAQSTQDSFLVRDSRIQIASSRDIQEFCERNRKLTLSVAALRDVERSATSLRDSLPMSALPRPSVNVFIQDKPDPDFFDGGW